MSSPPRRGSARLPSAASTSRNARQIKRGAPERQRRRGAHKSNRHVGPNGRRGLRASRRAAALSVRATYGPRRISAAFFQTSLATRFSMQMAYSPTHDRCHRQPPAVPGAFASIHLAAFSASSGWLHFGHRGWAFLRKYPPHSHGSNSASASSGMA